MQWLEKSSGFTQVQGLGSFKSMLTRRCATHHSFSPPEPRQIKPRALGVILSTSKSRRLGCSNSGDVLDQKTTLTQYICWCLSFHDVWINFLGFIVGLISRCCSRRASGREIAVLEVADNVFSNVQHSRNPVLKFCGRRTAGDLSKSAILRPRTFSWRSVFAAGKRTLHCYNFVVLDGESYGRGRLTSRNFSATCSPVWLPRKTTSPSKRNKSSSPPQESSHTWLQKLVEASDARATGRRSLSWRRSTLQYSRSTTRGPYRPPALQLILS